MRNPRLAMKIKAAVIATLFTIPGLSQAQVTPANDTTRRLRRAGHARGTTEDA